MSREGSSFFDELSIVLLSDQVTCERARIVVWKIHAWLGRTLKAEFWTLNSQKKKNKRKTSNDI